MTDERKENIRGMRMQMIRGKSGGGAENGEAERR